MPSKQDDLTGQTIGNRTVLGIANHDNRGRTQWIVECSCGRVDEVRADNIHRPCRTCARPTSQPKLRLRPFEACYNAWTHRARKRYPVSITYDQFLSLTTIPECHYCGVSVSWAKYFDKSIAGRKYGSNLDRKDNAKPYDFNNVVVCCGRCNSIKLNHLTYKQMLQVGALIRAWRETEEVKFPYGWNAASA